MRTYTTIDRAFARAEILRREQGIWTGVYHNHVLNGYCLLFDPLDRLGAEED